MLGCSQTSGNSPCGGKKAASRPANPANVANGASTVPAIADMAHLFSVDYGRPLILMNVERGRDDARLRKVIEISPGIPPVRAIGTAIRPALRRRHDP